MRAYCLFCQTQRCGVIASLLEMRGEVSRAFSPRILKRQRKQGVNVDRAYDLLPGYVFFFTEKELVDFSLLRGIDGVIRRIGSEEQGWQLIGGDYDFAMNLYRKDGMVGQITLIREGDAVRLSDPLFNGCSGTVAQIDYRKQRARVNYCFAGMDCFTWVSCELVRKTELETEN